MQSTIFSRILGLMGALFPKRATAIQTPPKKLYWHYVHFPNRDDNPRLWKGYESESADTPLYTIERNQFYWVVATPAGIQVFPHEGGSLEIGLMNAKQVAEQHYERKS